MGNDDKNIAFHSRACDGIHALSYCALKGLERLQKTLRAASSIYTIPHHLFSNGTSFTRAFCDV